MRAICSRSRAIEMIARYLKPLVFEPTNAEARNGMAVAQYIAGMAFSNVGFGRGSRYGSSVGSYLRYSHGVANALLLVIMEFNAPAAFVQICRYRQGNECVQGWHEPGRGCEGCC